jgi:trans-aconitate methyltransferase
MNESIQRFLSLRGIHYLVTRFGWKKLRSLSFDGKFQSGDWSFSAESPELVNLVEKYATHGHILALGCGTAPIASVLNPDSFESFLGVDLSKEAIRMAAQRANEKVRFETGDMMKHRCTREYDVILFSNSLYYVSWWSRKSFLRRLTQSLSPGGRIIVSLAQPHRYAGMVAMIRRTFSVDLDRALGSGDGHVLIFR